MKNRIMGAVASATVSVAGFFWLDKVIKRIENEIRAESFEICLVCEKIHPANMPCPEREVT